MNYHNILHEDMLNGEGLRVVLFVSGCTNNCRGCQNPQTHDFNSGIPFTETEEEEIYYYLSKPYIKGITFSGGDPMHPKNAQAVLSLCKKIKQKFGDKKDIWIYTGYLLKDLTKQTIEKMHESGVDFVVEGKFEIEYLSPNKPYVGSENQNIIDFKNYYIKRIIQNEI